MELLRQDLAHAARALARRPAFTAVAVLTLSAGIGGATSIFSVADAVVLRPLPFATPERLVVIWESDRQSSQPFVEISYAAFREWRDRSQAFEALAAMSSVNERMVLTGRGEPAALAGRRITAGFWSVLGVRPALGRDLLPEDDRPGAPGVVILSHGLWRERFRADPQVIGQSMTLDGQAFTIVGVMPAGLEYPQGAQLWTPLVPLGTPGSQADDGINWMVGLGRLKPGITPDAAGADLTGIWQRLYRRYFKTETYAAVLTPLSEAIFGPTRPALLALLGAVGLVLLVACTNVAGLLLVRVSERSPEMAVRQALGASRGQLARAVLAESLVVAALGGVAGLLAAFLGTPLIVALSPQDVPRLQGATVNARAFGFAFIASSFAAVLAGLAPMLSARRQRFDEALRGSSVRVVSGQSRLRATLVVSEMALALVLLVGAGLLARSFVNLRQAPLGFEPERVLSVAIPLPETRYRDVTQTRRFQQELLTRIRALPGVESAALVRQRPLSGPVGEDWPFVAEGQSAEEGTHNPIVNMEAVSSDYFRTMGIKVKAGRVFTDADVQGQPGVIVISETLARRCWPGQDPIGKRLKVPLLDNPYNNVWLTVIGIAGDARYRELEAARLDLYMSYLQSPEQIRHLVVRGRSEPSALVGQIRETVHRLDTDVPADAVTMAHVVSEALGGPRFAARLFGAFALVALLLAALGLYGVLAYSMSQRTREIGVRMALGAQRNHVRRLVLGEGLALTGAGIALGLAGSVGATRLIASLLYGVRPTDPEIFALAPLLLATVSIAACLLPVERAARVDPAIALRSE